MIRVFEWREAYGSKDGGGGNDTNDSLRFG